MEGCSDIPVGVAVIVGRGCLPTGCEGMGRFGGPGGLLLVGARGRLAEGPGFLAVRGGGAAAVGRGAVSVDGRAFLLLLVLAHGAAKVPVPVAAVIVLVELLINGQRHRVPWREPGDLQESSNL